MTNDKLADEIERARRESGGRNQFALWLLTNIDEIVAALRRHCPYIVTDKVEGTSYCSLAERQPSGDKLRDLALAGLSLESVRSEALDGIIKELAEIADACVDLQQNRNRPDSDPVMGWDNAKLTLGTLRKARALQQSPARVAEGAACPRPQIMGEHACEDRTQCWEPCGDLGHHEEYARPAPPPDKGENHE